MTMEADNKQWTLKPGELWQFWETYPAAGKVDGVYYRDHPSDPNEHKQFCMKGQLIGEAIAIDKTPASSGLWKWQLWVFCFHSGLPFRLHTGTLAELNEWATTHYWHPLTRQLRPGDIVRIRKPDLTPPVQTLETPLASFKYGFVSEVESHTGSGLVRSVWVHPYSVGGELAFDDMYIKQEHMIPRKISFHMSELVPYHFPDRGGFLVEKHPEHWGDQRCFTR